MVAVTFAAVACIVVVAVFRRGSRPGRVPGRSCPVLVRQVVCNRPVCDVTQERALARESGGPLAAGIGRGRGRSRSNSGVVDVGRRERREHPALAPEQVERRGVDLASDMVSLLLLLLRCSGHGWRDREHLA